MKQISENGLKLIKSFEGCRLTAYDDLQPNLKLTPTTTIKGTLTIGYGHTGDVYIGQTITQQQADELFKLDLQKFVNFVNNKNYVPFTDILNQNQFDALVSFAYNCGQGNLKTLCANTTLSKIAENILLYNKSKGQVLPGLVRRREAEKQLFITPIIATTETPKTQTTINIEEKIINLEKEVEKLKVKSKEIPVPDWAIKEFPNLLDHINTPTGSHDFWRSVIVALRLISNK